MKIIQNTEFRTQNTDKRRTVRHGKQNTDLILSEILFSVWALRSAL